jgi:hypothetical protein
MMSIDYTHCLRRRFTENILTPLLDGTSVNVVIPEIANEDKEANRLVKDIQGCELPNAEVLAVNMRACRGSYEQFVLDLSHRFLSSDIVPINFRNTILEQKIGFLDAIRLLYRANFQYNKYWQGKFYRIKQVAPVVKEEAYEIVVITVYTFYF